MRRFLSLILLFATSTLAFAQGHVYFNDNSLHLVYFTTDTSKLATADVGLAGKAVPSNGSALPSGATVIAELWAGTSATSLLNVSQGGSGGKFNTGTAGLYSGSNRDLPAPMNHAGNYFFQVQVHDTNGYGYYGESPVFTCNASSTPAYYSIVQLVAPASSTWAVGTYPLDSVAPGHKGAIMVQLAAPPAIPTQPSNQVVTLGGSASLNVLAVGAGLLSYQWQFNGTNLPGATTNSFTRTNAQLADAGTYSVVVTNNSGSVTSSNAVLQVLAAGAPSIRVDGQLAVGTVTAEGSAQVTMVSRFTNGFIFYTLDGTTPSAASPLYDGPITLLDLTTVRAMGLSADFSQSVQAPAVTVQFVPGYNLETSVVGSGAIAKSPDYLSYPSNTVVSLTATAAANWAFDHWTGDVSGNQNPVNLTMNGSRSAQAVFVQTAYPLTVSTPGGGSVSANGQTIPPATYYPTGTVVTLTATGSAGWNFIGWQGDASGTNNPLNLTISQANNIQGIFGTQVGSNIVGLGSIVLNPPNPVPFGTLLSITAVPASGYYFRLWSGAASGTNSPATFLVTNATPTVGALFLPGTNYWTVQGNDFVLGWTAPYVLQASTNVSGPYSDVPEAISPYHENMLLHPQGFFRWRQQQ